MLARLIVKKHIVIGKILQLTQGSHIYFVIPVCVKANTWWNLLVDKVEDVTATITFIQGGENQTYQSVWVNLNAPDLSFINLHIGSKRNIGLAECHGSSGLLPYARPTKSSSSDPIILNGDYDIGLQLRSDDRLLGVGNFRRL